MKKNKGLICSAFAFLAASLVGGGVALANADEKGTKTFDDIALTMAKGASMRIGTDENFTETGLRFTMQVSKTDYTQLNADLYESIEWGMLIAPVENVKAAEFNAENLFGANAKYVFNEETAAEGKYAAINVTETALTLASETNLGIENAENYYVFSGYMHSVREENLTRGFVGRGYVKYTVKGEETPQYKFAEYFGGNAENNTRSAYYVAAKYVADTEVTNAAAKTYVQEKYLKNATALATANVEITADNYLEDITIGTYKTEVSNSETVSAKIGEKYDLTAAGNAKENYVLRTDLSTTAEPVYRGQQLSIKRYYESESYIPFSDTAGNVSLATADDGEEVAGAYKYSAGGTGLKFADYTNKKTDKILRDVKVPENSKVTTINYVTMKLRWTGGSFNYVSRLGDYGTKDGVTYEGTENWCVAMNWFSGNGTNGTAVRFYNERGKRIFKVASNTWYTAVFPVITNYHDSARFGDAYFGSDSGETLYFKDVKIENSVNDPYDVIEAYSDYQFTVGSTLSSLTEATETGFEESKKFSTTSTSWNRGLMIANYDNAEGEIPTQQKNMINNGVRYITVNMYFSGAMNGITFYDNLGKASETSVTVTLNSETALEDGAFNYTFSGTTFERLRFYNANGERVYKVEKDTWYTVVILARTDGKTWGKIWLHPEGQDANNAAVIYYNNLRYSCVDPKA